MDPSSDYALKRSSIKASISKYFPFRYTLLYTFTFSFYLIVYETILVTLS